MVKLVVTCGEEEQPCKAETIEEVMSIASTRFGPGCLKDSEGYVLGSAAACKQPLEDGMKFTWIRAWPGVAGPGPNTAAGGGAGPGPSSAATEAKTVTILHAPPAGPTPKRLKSQTDLDKWLSNKGFAGLILGEGQPLVDEWHELVDGASYTPVSKDTLQLRVGDLESSMRHLGDHREEEFGSALTIAVAEAEQVDVASVQLVPEARVTFSESGTSEEEIDAVVVAETAIGKVVYLGSHKTYTNGTADVKLAAAAAMVATKRAQAPDYRPACPALAGAAMFKPAFMAEIIGPKAEKELPRYCKVNNIMRLTRSHGSIIVARTLKMM